VASYQVVCITKRGGHSNPYERITHIGISTAQGQQRFTQEQVIAWIDSGQHNFYVQRGHQPVMVVVAIYNGRKYLKTVADGYEPNNLLSLQEC